jgi:hypothetical protein
MSLLALIRGFIFIFFVLFLLGESTIAAVMVFREYPFRFFPAFQNKCFQTHLDFPPKRNLQFISSKLVITAAVVNHRRFCLFFLWQEDRASLLNR